MLIIKSRLYYALIAVLLALIFIIYIVPPAKEYKIINDEAFDTVSLIREFSMHDHTKKYDEILNEIDASFSVYNSSSITYALNNGKTVKVSEEYMNFIARAAEYSSKNGKYFDITVNPAINLWKTAELEEVLPSDPSSSLPYIGAEYISIDKDNMTVSLSKEGASVNFGAIAKGYATNVIKDTMISKGVKSGLINLGGNIYVHGTKQDNTMWQIGIDDPFNEDSHIMTISCKDTAIVTSNMKIRGFEFGDEKFSHIINPETGNPANSGVVQATIITPNAEIADMLSTAVFVAGLEAGTDLIKEYGVDAIVVTDTAIFYTSNLKDSISNTNTDLPLYPLM